MNYLKLAADFIMSVYKCTSTWLPWLPWLPWFQHCDYMLCILAVWSVSMI